MLHGGMVTQGGADRMLTMTSQESQKVAHPLLHIQKFLSWCGLPLVTSTVIVRAWLLLGTDALFIKLATPLLSNRWEYCKKDS